MSSCCLKKCAFQFFNFCSWAILILNNMFVVVVLCCVQFFFGHKKNPKSCLFSSSFPLLIFSSSLLSWLHSFGVLKMFHVWKYRTHYENPIKNQHPNNFQGSSQWATLILNSMFVVVVLYCVQFFFGRKKCQNHSLLSFSFPLLILFSFLPS